ncbi:MAG: hypothetical protein ACRD3E_05545 [Terriglobales bacterium]
MTNKCARGFALSLAVLFLASAALGQAGENNVPVITTFRSQCEPDTCIEKTLYLPDFSTAYELQAVVNIVRTIADIRYVFPNASEHTILLKGTAEQLAVTDRLVSVIRSLRASGNHDRTSVLVYELKGFVLQQGNHVPSAAAYSSNCELTTCFIKALYLPDLSTTAQLSDVLNKVRTTANITHMAYVPLSTSGHVIVIRGTQEQLALAEKAATE